MKEVMIIGAGSAGTHLAHAAHTIGLEVKVHDINPEAGDRMRATAIDRYYKPFPFTFHNKIEDSPCYIIATPPDTHYAIAEQLQYELMIVEKPLCPIAQVADFQKIKGVIAVNYNHLFSPAYQYFKQLMLLNQDRGAKASITAIWRESLNHILRAHPWITEPETHYLTDYTRGGGSAYEHSHGLAFVVDMLNITETPELSAEIKYEGKCDIEMVIRMRRGIMDIASETDFTTDRTVKKVRVEHGKFWKEVDFSDPRYDLVSWERNGGFGTMEFPKTRAQQFIDSVNGILGDWGAGRHTFDVACTVANIIGTAHKEAA
jgi:predicted dehydrogenase